MRKVLILSEHFAPAYKAGGIVRSLENLVRNFDHLFAFQIITGDADLGENTTMQGVAAGAWTPFDERTQILYLPQSEQNLARLQSEITRQSPDVIYINGLYSIPFVVIPLRILKKQANRPMVVVAPRGMLQRGALAVKPLKKKIYFTLFKLLKLHKHIRWHATDPQEVIDSKRMFGKRAEVILANDTPDLLPQPQQPIVKEPGSLRLVTISLITAKKGQLYLLEVLQQMPAEMKIEYHIYGPVKDAQYWQACLDQIKRLPPNITVEHKGNVHPAQVTQTLHQYHFFILPSQGENFGHAIYEALNAGRPVIISDQTPWKKLKEKNAGWDIDISNKQTLPAVIKEAYQMNQQTHDRLCEGARQVALDFVRNSDFAEQYQKLFLVTEPVTALS